MNQGQGALEYLLLVGGAVLISGIVLVLVLGVSQGGTSSAYNPVYSTIARQVMASNGVGWWKLDSATGLTDLSGRGSNGTPQGGITIGGVADHTGKAGGATSFDGSTQYVNLNGFASTAQNYTFSMWAKSTQNSVNVFLMDFENQRLVLAWNGGTPGKTGFFQSGSWKDIADAPSDGLWHSIVFVFSGSAGTLYIDGVSKGSGDYTGANLGGQVKLGTRYDASAYFFNGSISDVRIYNRVLSASEVLAIYNSS